MQDVIAALISLILIEPMQAHIAEQFAASGYSVEAANQAASCFSGAAPGILERAGGDPAWAVGHAFGYWTGTSTIEAIVADVAPDCVEPVNNLQS